MSRRWLGIPLPDLRVPKWKVKDTRGTSGNVDRPIPGRSDVLASHELGLSPFPPGETERLLQQPVGQQQSDDNRGAPVGVGVSKPAAAEAERPPVPHIANKPEEVQPRMAQQPEDRPQQTDFTPPSSPPAMETEPPPFTDNRGNLHDPPGNIHGRSFHDPPSILSNAQGTHIHRANIVAGTNVVFNHSSEDVARGKKLMLDNIASSALYKSQERFDPPKCEENTRVGLLSAIRNWIEDRSQTSARLQCITGSAGMGKSALVQTTVEQYEPAGLVAATFFFLASDPIGNNLRHFMPTIAYQIALSNTSDPALGNCIFRAVDRDPSIFKRSIERQLEELIVKPLRETFPQGYDELFSLPSFPYLICIDGLDECVDRKSQSQLLSIISTTFIDNRLPFKILLASRPERPLRAAILDGRGFLKSKSKVINLNDYDASADIKTFLQAELRTIGQESDDPRAQTNWPTLKDIDTLVVAAAGLFVYASTVVKFVSQRHRRPFQQLATVIQVIKGSNPTGQAVQVRRHPFVELDALYRSIIVFAQQEYARQYDDGDPLAVIRLVRMFSLPVPHIKVALAYSDPLLAAGRAQSTSFGIGRPKSVADMEAIFGLEPGELESMFSDLHSLYIVKWHDSWDAVIRPYHKSIQDFLLDPARCGEDLYIPHYAVVGRWTTLILGILAKASDSMLAGVEYRDSEDTPELARRLSWADFEMPYQVPLPLTVDDDTQWPVIMEEWHRIYKPFTDQGLFSRLACLLRASSTFTPPWPLLYIAGRTFSFVLGFMLYEAPRLAGSEWDPAVRQDMLELFDVLKERQMVSGRVFREEFPGLREPVSEQSLESWFDEMWNHQRLDSIYPWPGEAVGVRLRICQGEAIDDDDDAMSI
ncbi:hypothetical protein FA15DRAFT_760227 [Coprinopsis marcescibilis]|uniref:Nephrocystin 3-like N-terminal domain-containing protein n=1 Tax=Coprinopsis marcescibilis TaxID=230819 RepID=A0A5C3KGI2_COPMA|nr:hypothetical protein FA15DRAFT_760227 [Coprinopsis marcescibilis]